VDATAVCWPKTFERRFAKRPIGISGRDLC
jgi:hypothetical protein